MMELQEQAQTANQLMQLVSMNKHDIKKEMDRNYLQMLVDSNPTLKSKDFVEFITKCQLTGADPRLNQIYLIVHDTYNKQTGKNEPKGTTVLSYQYFIKLAQQTGELEDFDVDIVEDMYLDFSSGKKRPSLTATAWVKRKGSKYKFKCRLWEFAKTSSKDGSLFGNWKNSPYFMLEKCAVAGVMRWAFPEVLGNLYVADEMEKVVDSQNVEPKKNNLLSENNDTSHNFDSSVIENIKSEIKQILDNDAINWVEKCGKGKEAILEKFQLAENDPEKLLLILDFCKRVSQ